MFTLKVVALLISLLLAAASKIVPKISNGVDAQITEFPYLVSIQRIDVHICSGTLLSERWILSSARCFATVPLAELNIEYGHSEISPGPNGLNKARISRVIAHEDFAGAINDISVSESDIPMITGFHVPFAKLTVPGGSRFSSGTVSVHAGWGHVSLGVRTTTLQKASTNILSFDECVEAVADTQKPARNNICAMSDSVICTSDLGKNDDSCDVNST